jgi:hypothetical protein
MGTDGACSLLFCAAKRSGAFPPNIPAGLRARVSRLGGFTRPFYARKESGQKFDGQPRTFFLKPGSYSQLPSTERVLFWRDPAPIRPS